ncbi:unnamed protein product [Rangifer tarandus platyrhynchus]|uniref:Uncharacterized protein n=1 Tax=Rangifer tarandus platyrhynchus TaxID=3082113 RepID=A0AC59Y956_RANTA
MGPLPTSPVALHCPPACAGSLRTAGSGRPQAGRAGCPPQQAGPGPAPSPRGVSLPPAPLPGGSASRPASSALRQGEAWNSRWAIPQVGPVLGAWARGRGKGRQEPPPPPPVRWAQLNQAVPAPPPPTHCAHSLHNSAPTRPQTELQ